ncbi:unnamed protein product, partial [Pleuronectes platessa]
MPPHLTVLRTSSCGVHHRGAHIILHSLLFFILHHLSAHIILRRTSSPHIIVQRTSSCGAYHHHRTSSCYAYHHHRTSLCGAHHPAAHIVLQRTSSCGTNHPAVHIEGGGDKIEQTSRRNGNFSRSVYRTGSSSFHPVVSAP